MKVLITAEEIDHIVSEMARQINRDYQGKRIVVVGILKGAFVFTSDLVRKLKVRSMEVDFIEVRRYRGSVPGEVKILRWLSVKIGGRNVLVVEDIIDTGHTMNTLRSLLLKQNPRSLRIATLLSKPSLREVEVQVDYIGRDIPKKFVVGCGLDYKGRHRELPDIRVYPT